MAPIKDRALPERAFPKKIEPRVSPWRMETTLAGGFFLVIFLGLLGYWQTGRAIQHSILQSQQTEARLDACISQAKDVTLFSHDTASYTQSFAYTGNPAERERKWEAQEGAEDGFQRLQSLVQSLPRSAALQAQVRDAADQNRFVCEPLESRAIHLASQKKPQAAQAVLESGGTAARYRLEIQLEALVQSLEAYNAAAAEAGRRETEHLAMVGWAIQIVIFLLSLLIAIAVTRAASKGIRAVLAAQSELSDSEKKYRLLFEANPNPMWVYCPQTLRYLAVNDAAVAQFGYPREQFQTMTLLDVRRPEDRPAVLNGAHEAQRAAVWPYVKQGGALFFAEITSHPLLWAGQDAFMVTAQDVTQRLASAEALKLTQKRLHTVVGNAPMVLFSLDADGVFTTSEGLGLKTLGLLPGQVVGQSLFDLYADNPIIIEQNRRVLAGETVTYAAEANGHTWETQGVPLRGENGEIEGLISVSFDITERRQAEEALNRLAAIVQSSEDAIIGWTEDGHVQSWNPGAERLYGYTAAEAIGLGSGDFFPPEAEAERAKIREQIQRGLSVETHDTLRRHKDGRLIPVSLTSSPIYNEAGRRVGASTIARSISEQKKAEAMIRWQAYTDPLTSLPNRARFGEELEDAITRNQPFALVFADLDLFKRVNDSLGHAAGDQLLQQAASRFLRCLRPTDLLARMGGDEFTLLLPLDAVPETHSGGIAARLLESLTEPMLIDGHELHVSASVGFSRFPEDGADAATLLKHADLAMYEAKSNGRGRWQAFTPVLTEAAGERFGLESSLRKAIERDEMTLFYQPQVSLETGEIVGAEALVRWNHPEWGMVSPGKFIPLAEETGLIVPLGAWVLREACRQAALWVHEGRPLRVAVNLSARQLAERSLVPGVAAALEEAGLDAQWLDLELTESALIASGEIAASRLAALQDLGVRLSVDDFGTGYSSLAYLRRFPLDILKVDRSFVLGLAGTDKSSLQDQAVVRAVIDMAHALSLEVIAEGVETDAQRDILTRLGCDVMQGFLFSPPLPPECLAALLPPIAGNAAAEKGEEEQKEERVLVA